MSGTTPPLLAAIFGDIVGSVYEHRVHKSTGFPLWSPLSRFTDDTVMIVATAHALVTGEPYDAAYRRFGRRHFDAGYGRQFLQWLRVDGAPPYGSYGNGAAMRVAPVAWARDTLEEVLGEAARSARVSHDHPEGIRGAQAVAAAAYLARTGVSRPDIRQEITDRFGYDLDRTVSTTRPGYRFNPTCQGSVPEALLAFLEADDHEHAVRLAVSLGGDADTQACIAGALAGAYWGPLPDATAEETWQRLPDEFQAVLRAFDRRYPHGVPRLGA